MDQNTLYDIYSVWHVPFWQTTWFLVLMASVVGLLLVGLLILMIKRVRARRLKKTAWDQALYDLHEIHAKYGAEQCKIFYGHLTIILKKYLYARYSIDFTSKTDQEMIEVAHNSVLPGEVVAALQNIVDGGMLVKFANAHVIHDQMQQDFNTAVTIIKTTIPSSNKR